MQGHGDRCVRIVGRHLVPFHAQQHEVICLAKGPLPEHDRATAVIESFVDAPPPVDAVVHFAQANLQFPARADQIFRVNTASTQFLAEWGRPPEGYPALRARILRKASIDRDTPVA